MDTLIGFNIIPTLFLTLDNDVSVSFDVRKITNIEKVGDKTLITYLEEIYNIGRDIPVTYTVNEDINLIKEMIDKSLLIKEECIKLIKKYSE